MTLPPNKEALAFVQEETLSPAEAAERIIALCTKHVNDSLQGPPESNDTGSTPGLEMFLWDFWWDLFDYAIDPRRSMHARLIEILKNIKKRGKVGAEGWKAWREDFDWNDLPFFGPVSRENLDVIGPEIPKAEPRQDNTHPVEIGANSIPPSYAQARERYLNFCRFIVHLWAEDVFDYENWAIWMMREGVEDFDADSLDDVTHCLAHGSTATAPTAMAVEVASWCVQIAGEKMYRSTVIMGPNGNDEWPKNWGAPGRGGKRWKGVDGYHPDRWKLWKSVFAEVANIQATGELAHQAVVAAKAAIDAMTKIEDAAGSMERPPS